MATKNYQKVILFILPLILVLILLNYQIGSEHYYLEQVVGSSFSNYPIDTTQSTPTKNILIHFKSDNYTFLHNPTEGVDTFKVILDGKINCLDLGTIHWWTANYTCDFSQNKDTIKYNLGLNPRLKIFGFISEEKITEKFRKITITELLKDIR